MTRSHEDALFLAIVAAALFLLWILIGGSIPIVLSGVAAGASAMKLNRRSK